MHYLVKKTSLNEDDKTFLIENSFPDNLYLEDANCSVVCQSIRNFKAVDAIEAQKSIFYTADK